MPHGVPSEIRALVSAINAGLEIEKKVRYGKDSISLHPGPWWARKGVQSMDPQPTAVLEEGLTSLLEYIAAN